MEHATMGLVRSFASAKTWESSQSLHTPGEPPPPPMGANVREICLRYISKGECDRSCTRSHESLRGHTRELVIRFIRGSREAMNKKRKFDGVRDHSSHGGSWDRNGSRFGGGRGGRGGGRDSQNGGGRCGRGGNGPTKNPPHQDGQKKLERSERTCLL